jgi:hypothetical protein
MADSENTVDQLLTVLVSRVEDGTAKASDARHLTEAIAATGFTAGEDLQKTLAWQERGWWSNQAAIERRSQISGMLQRWSELWPSTRGFFAYRAAAAREALAQSMALPDEAQQLVEDEVIALCPHMSTEWASNLIPLLPTALSQERAALIETILRVQLREKSDAEEAGTLPEALLQTIVDLNTTETDRAFDLWLKHFEPNPDGVQQALLGMERERWKDIAAFVAKYVASLPQKEATSFVVQLISSGDDEVSELLAVIDPNNLIQSRVAKAQRRFLEDARNSNERRNALKRIERLSLTTNEARAQLVDQIFQTARQSDTAAIDVMRAFPKNLRDAPGVKARYKDLKKAVDPNLREKAERLRKKFLSF